MAARAVVAIVGGVLVAAALGACDPCSGIADCTGDPRVAVQGRIVDTQTGVPVRGASILVVRYASDSTATEAGAALDSASGTTDANGEFQVALATPGARGLVRVDVAVRPPEGRGYRVRGLRLRAEDRRGEVQLLPTWGDRPFLAYAGEAWPIDETEGRRRLAGEQVVFERVSGAELEGPSVVGNRVVWTTDEAGRFPLLGRFVTVSDVQPVVGRVGLSRNGNLAFGAPVVLVPTPVYMPLAEVRVFRLGLSFPYYGETRIGNAPVSGVRVDVRRVSGAEGSPQVFSTVSGAGGLFPLTQFTPAESGDVTLDLTFTPPAPLAPFTKRVTLPVFGEHSFGERFAVFHVDRPSDPPAPWP